MSDDAQPGKPGVVNAEDMAWQSPSRISGRFGTDWRDLTGQVPARKLDVAMVRLPPGRVSSPYHFHHASEELFYVLEGSGLLRLGGEERHVRPGDVVSCATGPEGAHQFVNDTDAPLVYLAISTVESWEVCEYPDSDKVLARAVAPDGTRVFNSVFFRSTAVDYFAGEPLADARRQ